MKTKHRLWQLTVFSIFMVLGVLLSAQKAINTDHTSNGVAITRGASTTASQTLTLVSGWNWVGFNVLPTSRTVGDVLGTTGFTVNDIIQTNSGSARFTGTSWTPASFTIEYGKLYQIYVANNVQVMINGEAVRPSFLPLTAGWNWIANSMLEDVSSSQLTHSNGWTENDRIQTAGGNGAAYIIGKWTPSAFMLGSGKGYQIFTANSGTLSFPTTDDELYVVVDLSGGPDATNYPVRYSANGPNLDDDTCRTTELWLRKIPAGTFIMGSSEDEVGRINNYDMIQHEVTLTQDFYIGVFECTQKQWELVMGNNPSIYDGDCRPVDRVSYDMIRGTGAQTGAGWPTYGHAVDSTSFMGKLQAKTGLTFDLPTEAQWEYACRAGKTTALNSGKNLLSTDQDTNMAEVGRYYYNRSDGKGGYSEHTKVGSYLQNAWGLYDMHGNIQEWCLDWWEGSTTSMASATDPAGPTTGSYHVWRGGGIADTACYCRSAYRYYAFPSFNSYSGFRIALHLKQNLYTVVNLSGGPNATSYPVRYTNTPPNLNDDTCRTTELWLRRIPAGTFIMGSPDDELGRSSDEKQHEVTLTEDYYIGVFECTQKQFELVMGGNPSGSLGDCRPVENITYSNLRGTEAHAGAGWPTTYGHVVDASSFMGKLPAKTGLVFDLPTAAQWEYACRAGTTTALNSGKNLTWVATDTAMDEVGRYRGNQSDSSVGGYTLITTVGSYLPNDWGLYDMHGNVWEWCLDWYSSYGTAAVVDPVGPNTSSNDRRVIRGGNWNADASNCRSAKRNYWLPLQSNGHGFRVAIHPKQDLYVVVDLSSGADAESYPVRYTDTPPNLDDNTCRTTELWLRKIPAGTFMMGSPAGELGRNNDYDMAQHEVTLTQDYYIGVFECTQRQWRLVMGSNPSTHKSEVYPVEMVSYDIIRGTGTQAGAGWPSYGHAVDATSFIGKLQAKTGLTFDLPTEAQWEYACRAGTTTALNSGKNLTATGQDANMAEVGRYYYNQSDGIGGLSVAHTKVGSYLPNVWGLYDMHGNVSEWCLDWRGTNTSSTAAATDPVGLTTSSDFGRALRGGDYSSYAERCRSASLSSFNPWSSGSIIGFRVVCLP